MRNVGGNKEYYTAWIPEEYARVGKVLKLKMDDGWKDGWHVTAVGTRASAELVTVLRDQHRHNREETDI
tara:strand:- start:112 stop:318 length:207 start_codon:yes stop_codon:yes gene_type:complete